MNSQINRGKGTMPARPILVGRLGKTGSYDQGHPSRILGPLDQGSL